MQTRITRSVLALVLTTGSLLALPSGASAGERDLPIRKGVYHGVWHTDKVQIIITEVRRDGAFVGELRFDPKGRWGDFRTGIKGRLNRDDSLSITRDDCDGNQRAEARRPGRRGTTLVWRGATKGPDFASNFELYVPLGR